MLLEWGPDSLVSQKPAGGELCALLGLQDEIVRFDGGEPTFELLHEDRLLPLPSGFVMMAPTRLGPLFESSLFTPLGKLRVAAERFVPPRRSERGDESLRDFVVRRFGREAYERVAEPILGGLFTADAERLSMRCAAPRLLELERRHGSVTAGMQRMRSAARQCGHSGAGGFFTIRSGLSTLVQRLAARLPAGCVRLATPVRRIERLADGYSIVSADGRETEAAAVVLAGPAWASAQMLRDLDPELAARLDRLDYASCSTVHLAYRREQVRRPLSTYGFFVPRASGLPILACTDVSAKYPGRAPVDRVLLARLPRRCGAAPNPTDTTRRARSTWHTTRSLACSRSKARPSSGRYTTSRARCRSSPSATAGRSSGWPNARRAIQGSSSAAGRWAPWVFPTASPRGAAPAARRSST